MTEIAFSASFRKAFKRKTRRNPILEKRFWNRVEIFRDNPFHPTLKTHKLTGAMKDWWSFTVDHDMRVIFSFAESNRAMFIDIGTHEEVY